MTGFFEDHLNMDSVVAYVDGELSLVAYQRAAAHIAICPLCSSEIAEQSFARDSLRSASTPQMPGSLAQALFSIPVAMPAAGRTPGVGIDANTGHAIRISHVGRDITRGRRFRLGAGALVAGIAVGAFATAGPAQHLDPSIPGAGIEPVSYAPLPRNIVQPAVLTDQVTTVNAVVPNP